MKKFGIKLEALNCFYDYWDYAKTQINLGFNLNVYPGITPMWDNSARRKEHPFILHNSTPEKYKEWLKYIKENYPKLLSATTTALNDLEERYSDTLDGIDEQIEKLLLDFEALKDDLVMV